MQRVVNFLDTPAAQGMIWVLLGYKDSLKQRVECAVARVARHPPGAGDNEVSNFKLQGILNINAIR